MHYCLMLITKKLPSESEIETIMKPYSEEAKYDENGDRIGEYPIFEYDYYVIGGRYNGILKLKVDFDDDYYRWRYSTRDSRSGKLFHSHLFDFIKYYISYPLFNEEDYYGSLGMRDGCLYVDGAKIKDLLNFDDVNCYICIDDVNKEVIARSAFNGKEWKDDKDFDEKLKRIKKNSTEYFATILDVHD